MDCQRLPWRSQTTANPQDASTTIVIDNPPLVVDLPDTINASCIDNTVIPASTSRAGQYGYSWTVGGIRTGR